MILNNKQTTNATTTYNLASQLPHYTRLILSTLNAAGYEAYLVGGAVRDLLLGKAPDDFDITTSAHPEVVLEFCQRQGWSTVDKLGNNFGCVVILIDGVATEVTTFRGERYNDEDVHRPAATWYCTTLKEDLSRRDFTINAMALDVQGRLYDYFGGRKDLKARLLRPVGEAQKRYREDALRMLRACRFVAQLGFDYVQDGESGAPCGMLGTPYYLEQTPSFPVERCAGLSLARVRKEMEKLLVAPHAGKGLMLMMATGILAQSCRERRNGAYVKIPLLPEAQHLLGLMQNPRYHIYDTWEHTLLAIDNSPRELILRWSLLLHDLGKGLPEIRKPNKEGQPSDHGHEAVSARMARGIMERWGYGSDFGRLVVWLVAQHMRFAPMLLTGERTLRRWLCQEAVKGPFRSQQQLVEGFTLLKEVFLADMGATNARTDAELMRQGEELGTQAIAIARESIPIATNDVNLNGRELLSLVAPQGIKEAYAYLIERIRQGTLANEHDALLNAIRKHKARLERADAKL